MLLIKGEATVTRGVLGSKIFSVNSKFDLKILDAYYDLAPEYGINPAVAMAQSNLETDWWRSFRAVTHHNYCGLGSDSNTGVIGFSSKSIIRGVEAHLAHLDAYVTKRYSELNNQLDPRYKYVQKARNGDCIYVDDLGGPGRWTDDPSYGNKIWKRYMEMGGK